MHEYRHTHTRMHTRPFDSRLTVALNFLQDVNLTVQSKHMYSIHCIYCFIYQCARCIPFESEFNKIRKHSFSEENNYLLEIRERRMSETFESLELAPWIVRQTAKLGKN